MTTPNNPLSDIPHADNIEEVTEAAQAAVEQAEEAAARGDIAAAERIAERFETWLAQQNSHFQTTLAEALKPITERLEALANQQPPSNPPAAQPIREPLSASEPGNPEPANQSASGDAQREAAQNVKPQPRKRKLL